jgi:hypothetical protein
MVSDRRTTSCYPWYLGFDPQRNPKRCGMDESSKAKRGETREFWETAIRLWTENGLSVREFYSREGLAEHAFYSWRRCIAAGEPSARGKTRVLCHGSRPPVLLTRTRLPSSSCRSASSAKKLRVPTRRLSNRRQQYRSRSSGHRPGACESWPASIRQPSMPC